MEKLLKLIKDLTWYNKVEKSKEILRLLTTIFLQDAPEDGNIYGRKDGAWEEVTTGGGGLEQREIVYLTEDTTLPSNANSEYYINEVNAKVTIQSGLYALGTSIIIYGLENDEIYSTFSDTQSGILINGNYVDETTPFLLQTSGNIILTKTIADDFAESWLASYEPNTFAETSVPGLTQVTGVSGYTPNNIRISDNPAGGTSSNYGTKITQEFISISLNNSNIQGFFVNNKSLSFIKGVNNLFNLELNPNNSNNQFVYTPTNRTDGGYAYIPSLLTTKDLPQTFSNFANDTDAAAGGVQIGQLYHTAGVVKIRLS